MVTSADPTHPYLRRMPAPPAFRQVVGQCALNAPLTISTAAHYPRPADRAAHLKLCYPMQQEIWHVIVLLGWAGFCLMEQKTITLTFILPRAWLHWMWNSQRTVTCLFSLFALKLCSTDFWLCLPPLHLEAYCHHVFLFPSTPLLWHLQLPFALDQSLPDAWLPSSCCRAQEKDDIARCRKVFSLNTTQ